MDSQLARILQIVETPAFLASDKAELLFMNAEMRRLVGARDTDRQRSLVGLGIFENQAEFRGFMRGFTKIGPVQRLKLPSTRMRQPSRDVVLRAVLIENGGTILGTISISEAVTIAKNDFSTPETELLDHIPQMVVMTDGEGTIKYLNHAARRKLPIVDGEATGMAQIDAEFSRVVWRENLLKARREGCCSFETHFFRRDGTLLPVNLEVCEVKGFPVHSCLIIATDVTSARQREQQLQAAKLELDNLQYQRERDKEFLRDALGKPMGIDAIVTGSSSFRRVLDQINLVSGTDSTVLITGETGTGKELIARAIHYGSRRAREPLIVVNCGALPRDLIESELFGYRKGAFTGATRDQRGRFELADGGTLFLDEIGEMPLDLQTRLLRFLQEGEFTPIGGNEPIYVNVRIVAATNRNLEAMVRKGEFRADLFFRLNVFPIHSPALRKRRDDIPLLVDHFIKKHGRRLNAGVEKADPDTLAEMMRHPFYGNIRELENIVERALITSRGKLLQLDWDIQPRRESGDNEDGSEGEESTDTFQVKDDISLTLDEMQRKYIEAVLKRTNGKVSGSGGAAEILGLNPQTLFSKIRKLGVQR